MSTCKKGSFIGRDGKEYKTLTFVMGSYEDKDGNMREDNFTLGYKKLQAIASNIDTVKQFLEENS